MFLKYSFFVFVLVEVSGSLQTNFIVDYFNYKRAPTVVGFSSYNIEENLILIKKFSELNIATVLNNFSSFSSLHLLANTDYWKLGIFLDLRYIDVEQSLFFKASEIRMFDDLRYWLVLDSSLSNVLQVIDDQTFGLSTDFVIAIFQNETDDYNLYDVYNLSRDHGGVLNVTFLGNWSKSFGLNISIRQSKFNRRTNLNGITLRTIYFKLVQKPKNVSVEYYMNNFMNINRDSYSKFGYHILSLLGHMYNFSLFHFESEDWKPGDLSGPLIRALLNKSADMGGTPFTMNVPRTYIIKYVHQDWPFRTCFIFRNPQLKNIKVQEILRPFSNYIWYAMTSLIILLLAILIFLLQFEEFNVGIMKLSNSILITFGALCQQGVNIEIKRLSTRIVLLSTFIFTLLMYNFYSASIVSARLAEPIYKINDSLNEMGKLNLRIASEEMGFIEYFLRQPHWDAQTFYEKYWKAIPKSRVFVKPPIGMKKVQEGGFAHHTFPDVSYPFIKRLYDNREICELTEVHLIRPMKIPFALTFNSSFLEITRVGLTKVAEVGLTRRQTLKWSETRPFCRKDILSAATINIYEFAPHLLLLLIGMLIAIFIYAIEISINYIFRK